MNKKEMEKLLKPITDLERKKQEAIVMKFIRTYSSSKDAREQDSFDQDFKVCVIILLKLIYDRLEKI